MNIHEIFLTALFPSQQISQMFQARAALFDGLQSREHPLFFTDHSGDALSPLNGLKSLWRTEEYICMFHRFLAISACRTTIVYIVYMQGTPVACESSSALWMAYLTGNITVSAQEGLAKLN